MIFYKEPKDVLTEPEMLELVRLSDEGYFRLRLIQLLEQLVAVHGDSCGGDCCECDEKNAEIERLLCK